MTPSRRLPLCDALSVGGEQGVGFSSRLLVPNAIRCLLSQNPVRFREFSKQGFCRASIQKQRGPCPCKRRPSTRLASKRVFAYGVVLLWVWARYVLSSVANALCVQRASLPLPLPGLSALLFSGYNYQRQESERPITFHEQPPYCAAFFRHGT